MRTQVLAAMIAALLWGCVDATTPPPAVPPTPSHALGDTLTKIASSVDVVGRVVALICEVEGNATQVCQTLDTGFRMVKLALAEANQLYDVYQKTGLGKELVTEAMEKIFVALDQLNDNAARMKGAVSHGTLDTGTRAYCYSRGAGSWLVGEPQQAPAVSAARASTQPLPSPTP